MGFTPVDNEFFKWLPDLTGNELKVLLAFLRESAGWHKPVAKLSLSEISSVCGIPRKHLSPVIADLVRRGKVERYKYKGSYKYIVLLYSGDKENKVTQACYLKHSPEDCPYLKNGVVETRCLRCPRYLLHKKA